MIRKRNAMGKDRLIKNFIKDSRQLLKDNLVKGYLFGSYSRNEQTPESDIDLLLIVRTFDIRLREKISSLSSDYLLEKGVIISPIIKDVKVWEKNRKYDTHFYKEIMKDGIRLC
jgi:predicted nucleotidyltransferase